MFDRVGRGSGYQMSRIPESEPSLLRLGSKLAGEPWTGRPATCVHPTLAAMARSVDDHSSPAGRPALKPFAQALVDTAQPGFDVSARLVAVCVSTALASPDQERITAHERTRLCAARQTALHLLHGHHDAPPAGERSAKEEARLCGAARWWMPVLGWVGLSEPFYRCLVTTEQVAEAVEVTARASGDDRDRRLRQLLKLGIAVVPSTEQTTEEGTATDESSTEREREPRLRGLSEE